MKNSLCLLLVLDTLHLSLRALATGFEVAAPSHDVPDEEVLTVELRHNTRIFQRSL